MADIAFIGALLGAAVLALFLFVLKDKPNPPKHKTS